MKNLSKVLLLSSLILNACGSQTTESGDTKTIQIGVVAPLSGDAAAFGQELQHVLDYTLEKINTKQLDSGYQFELIYEDGQCGSTATQAFQKLTEIYGVDYLLGGGCSPESLAIAPLLVDNQVIALSALSSSPELNEISPNFFSMSYSDAGVGEAIAKELSGFKKVAILSEQTDYAVALHDTVLETLKAYPDVEIVADETVTKGSTDFRNALQKVKAAEPDVVFFNPMVGVTSSTLLKQLAELSDWEAVKVGGFALMDSSYLELAPETLEGTIVVDTPQINATAFLEMSKAVTENEGTVETLGSFYTASSYDALDVLTTAIIEGNNDYKSVLNVLRTGTFEGYLGSIHFGEETFVQGIGTAVYTVENGSWVAR